MTIPHFILYYTLLGGVLIGFVGLSKVRLHSLRLLWLCNLTLLNTTNPIKIPLSNARQMNPIGSFLGYLLPSGLGDDQK